MAKEAVPNQLIDKRVVERNMKKGLVTREAFEKYLSSLPDVAAQSETIKAKLDADDGTAEDEASEEAD